MMYLRCRAIAILVAAASCASAFVPSPPRISVMSLTSSSLKISASAESLEEMDEERKSNLFQTLLRDLQIEGVPLLGCDANQVSTLSAAIWTTMAELGDSDEENKACLILGKRNLILLVTQPSLIQGDMIIYIYISFRTCTNKS